MWKVRIFQQRKSNEKRSISVSIASWRSVAVSFHILFKACSFTCNKIKLSWDMKWVIIRIFLQLSGTYGNLAQIGQMLYNNPWQSVWWSHTIDHKQVLGTRHHKVLFNYQQHKLDKSHMRGIGCLSSKYLLLCCGKLGRATSSTTYVVTQQATLGQTEQILLPLEKYTS